MPFEVKEITKDYPPWVYKAYVRGLTKRFNETIGFVPSFVKV
jgi:hypothetical protein